MKTKTPINPAIVARERALSREIADPALSARLARATESFFANDTEIDCTPLLASPSFAPWDCSNSVAILGGRLSR